MRHTARAENEIARLGALRLAAEAELEFATQDDEPFVFAGMDVEWRTSAHFEAGARQGKSTAGIARIEQLVADFAAQFEALPFTRTHDFRCDCGIGGLHGSWVRRERT